MASKINRKRTLDAKGVIEIDGKTVLLSVEDENEPRVLADLLAEFEGKEVKIVVGYAEEL